jgi:hypothetical protein
MKRPRILVNADGSELIERVPLVLDTIGTFGLSAPNVHRL